MLSASEIILEYVCPTLGGLTAFFMFAAPLRDVYRAAGLGSLGDLNPTPWAFMLGNCYGWVTYSILLRNFFIFFANAPGLLFAVWLNLKAVELLSGQATVLRESLVAAVSKRQQLRLEVQDDRREGDPSEQDDSLAHLIARIQTEHAAARRSVPHEILVMCMVIAWFSLTSLLVFGRELDQSTKELIVGSTVNLNLVFFYGAPLSTIWTVLRSRSSASIHVPTMLTNTANGTFWCAYGLAVQDYFIVVPNGLGALLGVVQMLLCVVFPKKRRERAKPDDAGREDGTASMRFSHRSGSSPSMEIEYGGSRLKCVQEDPTSTSE